MLVQCRLHLLLVAEDVVEARGQLGSTLAIEHDLTCANITMGHVLVVHELKCAQNLLGKVLQDGLGHGPYALGQIVKAAIRGVVLNH